MYASQSALEKFIQSARQLFAEEKDRVKRWENISPLLEELLADKNIKEQSKRWPDCSQGSDRAENLLFYEDPDYGFVLNALIKDPRDKTPIHDHGHTWVLYGVLTGAETVIRFRRDDDDAVLARVDQRRVQPGYIDVVPPHEIHAEWNDDTRTIGLIFRTQRVGTYLQNWYDENGAVRKHPGPEQVPYDLT